MFGIIVGNKDTVNTCNNSIRDVFFDLASPKYVFPQFIACFCLSFNLFTLFWLFEKPRCYVPVSTNLYAMKKKRFALACPGPSESVPSKKKIIKIIKKAITKRL